MLASLVLLDKALPWDEVSDHEGSLKMEKKKTTAPLIFQYYEGFLKVLNQQLFFFHKRRLSFRERTVT